MSGPQTEAGKALLFSLFDHEPQGVKDHRAEQLALIEQQAVAAWLASPEGPVARLIEAAETLRGQHRPDPEDTSGMGWLQTGYGTIDPACSVCGTPDEYAEAWPCPTFTMLDQALAALRSDENTEACDTGLDDD